MGLSGINVVQRVKKFALLFSWHMSWLVYNRAGIGVGALGLAKGRYDITAQVPGLNSNAAGTAKSLL
ncbi:hypothetical protein GCM10025791_10860 [Halioxenophilus aromaticivorans]|uniref:Uncharacterized protein n=1 Tax=Halioxenophilus aromaticivorans TaxID=1306992 RepID=A0AAV3TZR7_9ALTE